jgi:hypothetical protein
MLDAREIHIRAEPLGKEPWEQSVEWDDVIQAFLKMKSSFWSSVIYILGTTDRKAMSYQWSWTEVWKL